MTAAPRWNFVSIHDYLAGEEISPVKHDFIDGVVYAMAGATNAHNMIAVNVIASLHAKLRGGPCRPFNSDTKVRIRQESHLRLYYPDAMIVCRQNRQGESFQDEPAVIFEVVSDSTRRIDEGEKRDAYLTIPTLGVYVVLEQDAPAALVYERRKDAPGFTRRVVSGKDAVLRLEEVDVEVPLSEIYDGVEFPVDGERDAPAI